MIDHKSLETMFRQALAAMPYDLKPIGNPMGEFELDNTGYVEYSEDFTATVGQLFDMDLIAVVNITLQHINENITITAKMYVGVTGDLDYGPILSDYTSSRAAYDFKTHRWRFWIERH